MKIKEKFSTLPIKVFDFDFSVFYVKNDNDFWYEIIATKDDKEYYVCKLDYEKTYQGIRTFLLKDTSARLKEKYKNLNIKTFKNSIKINDKLFSLKKPKQDNSFSAIYDLKVEMIQYIEELQEKNILVA